MGAETPRGTPCSFEASSARLSALSLPHISWSEIKEYTPFVGFSNKCDGTHLRVTKSALSNAPIQCEDWRDFNVHCAALNIMLGKKIIKDSRKLNIIVTGDLINEFVCDYKEENYEGKRFYKLPNINKKSLQKWLTKGLSTSSREDRVFDNFSLHLLQPYAIAYDLYSSLTSENLELVDVKRISNLGNWNRWLDDYIAKDKIRAQVGNKENMGVLGLS